MKITNSLMVAIMAITITACTNDESSDSSLNIRPVYSGQMEAVCSRVTLDDSYMPNWEMDDTLSIFPEYDVNNQYKVVEINDSKATFEFVGRDSQEGTQIGAHYAVYPYNAGNSISNGVITTLLPAEVEYTGMANSIRHALMTAKSENERFTFTNAMGILRLRLNAQQPFQIGKVRSIQLVSATQGLCGTVTVDYSGGSEAPSAVIEATEDNRTLTLTVPESLRALLAKWTEENDSFTEFYIPMAPATFAANDLQLVITGTETYSKPVGCVVSIERKKIFTLTHTILASGYEGGLENQY